MSASLPRQIYLGLCRLLPPVLVNAIGRWRHPANNSITFTGDYPDWDAARRASSGYDNSVILEKTRSAIRQVRDGTAIFERDSVLLAEPEPPFALLAGLLAAAAASGGCLRVLDFGGSLGSTYFQCRPFLAGLAELRWSIVEQPAHVACGQAEFATDQLRFHATVDACLVADRPSVLVLSSVLPYLPEPRAFLADMVARQFDWILVDRTFFHDGPRDRLTVQRVPRAIYAASYPAWFLSRTGWAGIFANHYDCLAEFPALDRPDLPGATARGMIYRRR